MAKKKKNGGYNQKILAKCSELIYFSQKHEKKGI
jgi:hypothetical protein